MIAPPDAIVCSAVLFDLDGVLVQSGSTVEWSWRNWAHKHGFDPATVLRLCHGRRSVETVAAVAPHLDARAEAAWLEAEQAIDTAELSACPGAVDTVRTLPESRWAVVTSGTRRLATTRLGHVGLPIPTAMVAGDDVIEGKPSPEGYLRGAALLGFAPAECVVVEDARPGVLAARAAGMRVIGVAGLDLGPVGEVDLVVNSLSELLTRIGVDERIVILPTTVRVGSHG